MYRYLMFTLAGLTLSMPNAAAKTRAETKERMICKSEPETGTRFQRKTCRTAVEWDEIAEANRQAASEMANRPQIELRRGN